MPQIDKVLTISSSHITLDTSGKLDVEPAFNEIPLPVYPKAEYGWWILIDSELIEDHIKIPADLMECIKYAWKRNCKWLCLDCDGEIVPELPVYDWN